MKNPLVKLYNELQEKKVISPLINHDDFNRWLDNFIDPPFSTSDFEASTIRNRAPFQFKKMNFMGGPKGFPNLVIGTVTTDLDEQVKVYWDQNGRCRNFDTMRKPDWDLINPEHKDIDSAKTIVGAMMLILIVVISCIV